MFFISLPATVTGADPVRIGVSLSMEGKYREPSAMMLRGYRLWERQVNERGGLLGRPVALIVKDDQSRAPRVTSLYRLLIEEEGVDLVLSPYGTPLTLAAMEVTEPANYVMLASAASGERIWNRGADFVFGVYAPAERYFIGFLDLMARNGFDSVAVVYEDSPFHRSVARGVRIWAERFGVDMAAAEAFASVDPDLARPMAAVYRTAPDAVILSAYPPEGYRILGWMQAQRWRPAGLGVTIAPVHPDFGEKLGSFAEGIVAPSQWEPDERIPFPGTEKFIADFKNAYGTEPSYHAGSAYASCQILERAVLETGAIDHHRIRDFIRALDTVTVIGRFKVNHTGKQVGHNPILIQWQEGKKQIVYPNQMKTADIQFDSQNDSPRAPQPFRR